MSTLLSVKTGSCPEDCAYCPQSAHHNTNLEKEKLISIKKVKEAAIKANSMMDVLKIFEKNVEAKYEGKEIPRPKHWYGYCVYPDCFEFWLQGEGRLHDRVEYKLKSGKWISKLLYP